MSDEIMIDPSLSPEEAEWVRRAEESVRRRVAEGDFALDPENRDKLIGGLQGVRTVRSAPEAPVRLTERESESDRPG